MGAGSEEIQSKPSTELGIFPFLPRPAQGVLCAETSSCGVCTASSQPPEELRTMMSLGGRTCSSAPPWEGVCGSCTLVGMPVSAEHPLKELPLQGSLSNFQGLSGDAEISSEHLQKPYCPEDCGFTMLTHLILIPGYTWLETKQPVAEWSLPLSLEASQKAQLRAGDDSTVKSAGCSSRGCRFDSQYPCVS